MEKSEVEVKRHPSLEGIVYNVPFNESGLLESELEKPQTHIHAIDQVLIKLQPIIENKQRFTEELNEINGLIEKIKPILEARGALISLDESFDNFADALKQLETKLTELIALKSANAELEREVLTKLNRSL